MRFLSLILALAAVWPAFATTQAPINPVAGVRSAKLEWQVGEALSRNQRVVRRLFEGDAQRLAAFRRRLEATIQKRFSESGIQLSRDAKHTLVLGIWGQTADADHCQTSVALLEASFHDERLLDDPEHDSASIEVWSLTLLEVTDDATVERSLEAAVLHMLDDLLYRGTREE
jgi:hypothetical protein